LTSSPPTILFAGGGTGGHIYPCVAIWQRLEQSQFKARPHFAVSTRSLDGEILNKLELGFTPLPARPLTMLKPWTWSGFLHGWQNSTAATRQIIDQLDVAAVVATGGFVAAPVVQAASQAGVPIALVNLDAVPGRANKLMAHRASELFTVYPTDDWPDARPIGLPLRETSVGPDDKKEARRKLGVEPDRDMLLVTGGSQGAESINRMMIQLLELTHARQALANWQVLHLAGPTAADTAVVDRLHKAYHDAGVTVRIETYCNVMGLAWRSATLAIARAGAGTVAEVWANAAPTIFLPYPHHRDQHQRRNANPLASSGAAIVLNDQIDPAANARQILGPLTSLIQNAARREHMIAQMNQSRPDNGAESVATWIARNALNR